AGWMSCYTATSRSNAIRGGILIGFERQFMRRVAILLSIVALGGTGAPPVSAQSASHASEKTPSKIILDTDIGDDIDDAFAFALALRSPEIEVIGITTAWGDTALRARLANRLLSEADVKSIPVLAGISTANKTNFTQADWAR